MTRLQYELQRMADAQSEKDELLGILQELIWAIDGRHGRRVSDVTRREMAPVADRARAILAKHEEGS